MVKKSPKGFDNQLLGIFVNHELFFSFIISQVLAKKLAVFFLNFWNFFVNFSVSLASRATELPLGFNQMYCKFYRCNEMFFKILISRIQAFFENTLIFLCF